MYDAVRSSLLAGRYLPGERLDPNALARAFATSPTPVLHALYILVGEGAITGHRDTGFRVPQVTEPLLRDLYDWTQHMLAVACDAGFPLPTSDTHPTAPEDVVLHTRVLFEDIAATTRRHWLHRMVRQANARLGPIERIKQLGLPDAPAELARLNRLWQARNVAALRKALHAYHARRLRMVPRIVEIVDAAIQYGSE